MKSLHNFNALQSQEMEWVVGGMDPQAGAKEEVAKAILAWGVGKALDATVEAAKSVDWEKHDKEIAERMDKNMRDLCNDTKLPPFAW